MSVLAALRVVLAALGLFVLPGLGLSFWLFGLEDLPWIERLALSLGLSVTVVPLVIFYLNLLGLPITAFVVMLEVLVLLLLIFGGLFVRRYRQTGGWL